MKKSINELHKPWRYCADDCIEIDEHLTNYRPSSNPSESPYFAEILFDRNDNRYIRHHRNTYYLDI